MEETVLIKTDEKPVTAPVIIEFGKKSKKSIRQLSEGHGKLFGEVNAAVADLKTSGTISPTAQPVIVVVKQKLIKKGLFGF